MKADFIHHRCVSLRGHQRAACRLLPALAVLCLLTLVTAGCQTGHGHQAAVELHYGQLEQACFGYEPTVWRDLPGDCAQAVRMIPDEIVQLPAAAPTPATSPEQIPDMLPMEDVPEPGQETEPPLGLFRDLPPVEETPPPAEPTDPATEVPATPPAEPAPAPAPVPGQEQPAAPDTAPSEPQPPTAGEPKVLDTAPVDAPQTPPTPPAAQKPPVSSRAVRTPVSPVTHRSTPTASVAANNLFRSMEEALSTSPDTSKPARERTAGKHSAVGLARFISY